MGTRLIGDVARERAGEVQARKDLGGVDVIGIPTGFWQVDEFIGGLQPDTVGIVAGLTSSGKSALALDIALNVARQNNRVILYSLEMSASSLTDRLLSRMTGVPAGRISRGKVSDDEMRQIRVAVEELSDSHLALCDSTHTSDSLRDHAFGLAEAASKSNGPDLGLVIIDYAGLLRDPLRLSEIERMDAISKSVRAMARSDALNIPIVMLAQMNRDAMKREGHLPILSDLKSSSSLEQDSEWIIFCHREHYFAMQQGAAPVPVERDAKLVVAKNRNGPVGQTKAEFWAAQTMWKQAERPVSLSPKPIEKGLTKRG